MNKVKYLTVLFFALTLMIGCKKRNTFENNRFSDKTFNWEITIPDDYEKINQSEKTEIKAEEHSIVAFQRDKKNYFSADYQDYKGDVRSAGLKMKLNDFVVLRELGKINPKGQMGDYAVINENISGLEFRKAKVELTEKGKTVATAVIFSSFFGDKIFIATIVYDDEDYGKAMIDLFKQSTFKK